MTNNVINIKAYKKNLKAKKNKSLLMKILVGLGIIVTIPVLFILSLSIVIVDNLGRMIFGVIRDMQVLLVEIRDNICDFYKDYL